MKTTIGFFGDSFCAGGEPESWCRILANKINATVVHWGQPGRSIWTTIMEFNKLVEQNNLPAICVFCYTEPYRLYHPKLILSANTQPLPEADPKIYQALDQYWIHLHSYDKDELAYEYAVRWFDHAVLSQHKDKTIVQMWSFKPFETAGKDANIKLKTGIFIDESMYHFSLSDDSSGSNDKVHPNKNIKWGKGTINHMTKEQNEQWANKVYERIKS